MSWDVAAPIAVGVVFLAAAVSAPARPRSPVGDVAAVGAHFDAPPPPRNVRQDGRVGLEAAACPHFAEIVEVNARRADGPLKRAVDIVAAVTLLVVFAPLMALIAGAIKLDSAGPVFYRQARVGRGGRIFQILKFRSMKIDAECEGARWAEKDDKRVTRVGRVIRKLRLDETPQTLNILRGEMSLVGPRPERPEFVEILEAGVPAYPLRHKVRPGLTGWAQVKYVYGASIEDARIKLQYDLFYIQNFSVIRDVMIMAMTVKVVLFGVGAR